MTTIAILVGVLFVIVLVGLVFKHGKFLAGIMAISAVVVAFAVGSVVGEENTRLPDVTGQCRGRIELSWKTKDYKVNEIRDELEDHAHCDAKVVQQKIPPPFPQP